MALSEVKIRQAKPKDKDYKLTDERGLFLLIKQNGGRYWRFSYRFQSKQKTLSLGVYPDVSLKLAREQRDAARTQVAQGIDPSAMRKHLKNEADVCKRNSFESIAWEWFEKKRGEWSPATLKKRDAQLKNDLLPYLGRSPIEALSARDLISTIDRIQSRGAIDSARCASQIVKQVFQYAFLTDRLENDISIHLHATIKSYAPTHRPAITVPHQFALLLDRIDHYRGHTLTRALLKLLPLLFQRPGEVCGMRWSEVSFEDRFWIIPRQKLKNRNTANSDHIVPLSIQAIEIMSDIRELTGNFDHVFYSRGKCGHQPTETVNKAIRSLGYNTQNQHCAHGFRASARTMLDEQLGQRVDWIEQQLAHNVRDPLGRAYNRTQYLAERTTMMQVWADYLDQLKFDLHNPNAASLRHHRAQ